MGLQYQLLVSFVSDRKSLHFENVHQERYKKVSDLFKQQLPHYLKF